MDVIRLDETAVFQNLISEAEHKILLDWANEQRASGALTPNVGLSRYYSLYTGLKNIPPEFWAVRDRLIEKLKITQWEEEPVFKCFLSCNAEGGAIHKHKDPTPDGMVHLRCNLMLSKPEVGGDPIIEGHAIRVEERECWAFYPSERYHWSTHVHGPKPRFTASFGFLVPRKIIPIPLQISKKFTVEVKGNELVATPKEEGGKPIVVSLNPAQVAIANQILQLPDGFFVTQLPGDRELLLPIIQPLFTGDVIVSMPSKVPGARVHTLLPEGDIKPVHLTKEDYDRASKDPNFVQRRGQQAQV